MELLRAAKDKLPQGYMRIFRYLVAGGVATVTNLGLLYVLTSQIGIWYIYSSFVSLSAATIVSFLLQKLWTFQNLDASRVHVQFPLHVALALTNIVFNTILLYAFVEWLHIWYVLAQFISGGMLACMNYFVYKHIIFPHRA